MVDIAFAILLLRISSETGFVKNRSAPLSIHLCWLLSSDEDVRIITGIWLVAGFFFTFSHNAAPSIPFIISADLEFTTLNDDGTLTLAMNNERSIRLLEVLNDIFYSKGTGNAIDIYKDSTNQDGDTTNLFKSGRSLILGYNRLGSFGDLRDMEDEVGILPYPKFDENQKEYVSSSHDTTEIGVIPITNSKFDTTCAVLEVLMRETQKIVLPAYYETGLKVKYSRDDLSSQMIDIIHDSIGGSFALAYSSYCSDIFMKNSFYEPLYAKKRDFVSNYVKREKGAQTRLNKMVENFLAIEQ